MQVDALAVRLRPRSPLEAADLGVRLCRSAVGSVYRCHAVVAVPVGALALASYEIAGWLPVLVMWMAKPWLDRTTLFVLSRAAFGRGTSLRDLWSARRSVWLEQLLFSWTARRLSPWRSVTQPVYQLEGASAWKAGRRVALIRRRTKGQAFLVTIAFWLAELALTASLFSLSFWLAPKGAGVGVFESIAGLSASFVGFLLSACYVVAAAFVEPMYVGAGFAMYLNRRADLEAWDVEQDLRRTFAPTVVRAAALALALAGLSVPAAAQVIERDRPTDEEIAAAIAQVKADPNLATERTIRMLRWIEDEQARTTSGWLQWIADLFAWLGRSARALVWVSGALLAALLLLYVVRAVQGRVKTPAGLGVLTHVRDLDIRPESLPADIGDAARALWDRGERRAALALLYRGLLSRLVHVHHVPIRDSTTEGGCLALAAAHLPVPQQQYVSQLVSVWQRFVYGGQEASTADVHGLCRRFSEALDRNGGAA